MIDVTLSVELVGSLALSIEREPDVIHLDVSGEYIGGGAREYEGPYEVTPSSVKQVLSTRYLKMAQDVIVAPVPSNYGLISWDGSSLMVS